jgi:type VI protein secretion system component Hcp
MTIYVLFSGPIDDYCVAESLQFGMQVERIAGGGNHGAQTKPIVFTKKKDSLSHDLFVAAIQGSLFDNIDIEYWQGNVCTFVYHLNDATIASASSNSSHENYALEYEKIWMER